MRVCRISIVQKPQRTEIGITLQHWSLWEQNLIFAIVLLILVLATYSKRVKVVYWFKEVGRGHRFLLESSANTGGRDNPFSVIIIYFQLILYISLATT